jgi:integrase
MATPTPRVAQGVLTDQTRFTFHDLRAFYATQHKAERGTLPDLHKNPGTTARVYDRNKVVRRYAL